MASHTLTIAKASLAAGMIRPDPISIPRTEIAQFHEILEATLKQCSSKNIQLCKEWLLKNIIPSAARTAAVGKYLVALSESFTKPAESDESHSNKVRGPSGRRRQLHILYLLNDLLHHTRYHIESSSTNSILTNSLHSYLQDLFRSATAYNLETYPRQHRKIQELLKIWETNAYYQPSFVEKLQETVSNAIKPGVSEGIRDLNTVTGTEKEILREEKKDGPYIMPASHGDPSTPFYDLPAGNMLPYIIPNSSAPINPQLVKPLQFVAGPADESLVVTVKDFLQKAESLDDSGFANERTDIDLDELGQCVLRDEITGDVLDSEGYYGWSRAFCEKMKRRRKDIGDLSKATQRDHSMDRSLSPRKRRRYSEPSGSHSRSTSRPSSLGSREGRRYLDGRRSSSSSRSQYKELRQYYGARSRSRSKSRSPSYSPPQTIPAFQQSPPAIDARPSTQVHSLESSAPPPPFSHPFPQGFPFGPNGLPIPPPPPPNYQGQWPPPPPPMPNSNTASPPNFTAPQLPSSGPRTNQHQGSVSFVQGLQSNLQGQTPSHSGPWGQQSGYGGGIFQGVRGRGSPGLNSNVQSGQGRGFGRGGWGRN